MTFVDPPLRATRIAIIGFGPNTQAPEAIWADDSIEKWTLNHGHVLDARWDRLFEFHDRATIVAESRLHTRNVSQIETLAREAARPIYMRERQADVPASVRFPIEDWIAFHGRYCEKLLRRPYGVSAVALMIGEAIRRLVEFSVDPGEIFLYGIELIDDEEWAHQRACVEFFVGMALGFGIRVHVPDASAVLASNGLYEYENGETNAVLNWQAANLQKRWEQARDKYAQARKDNDDAVARMHTFSAVMQEIEQEKTIVGRLLRGSRYEVKP